MRVSRLERRLGVKLLERNSRRVALTREGQRLLPRIDSLLEEAQLLVEESEQAVLVPGGSVRIAITPAVGGHILKHLVPRVRKTHPDMRLIFDPKYDFDDLQDPNFDFAIRVGQIKDENLVAKKVGSFRRVLIASPELMQENKPTRPSDLVHLPCLIFSAQVAQTDWHLESVLDSKLMEVISVQGHIATRNFSALIDLAAQGIGIASVPEFMVHEELADGRLVRCLPDWQSPSVDVMLAYRFGASRVARVGAALKETRKVITSLLG